MPCRTAYLAGFPPLNHRDGVQVREPPGHRITALETLSLWSLSRSRLRKRRCAIRFSWLIRSGHPKRRSTAALQNVAVIQRSNTRCVLECGDYSPLWISHSKSEDLQPNDKTTGVRRLDVDA